MAGLVLDIAPGWKTYWRNPGAAGIPPQFDWTSSRNLGSAEVFWPRPKFFESFGLTTIGYSDRVVLPVRLVPQVAGAPIELGLNLSLGVCRDICVLEETSLTLRLEPDAQGDGSALIAAAMTAVPRPGAEQGMTAVTCQITGTGPKRSFDAKLDFGREISGATVVLEGPETAWFDQTVTEARDGSLHVSSRLSLFDGSAWVSRSQVRMTVLAENMAADIQGCAAPAG
ncbi:MAG TPA: protein-disulfide reductase DsbD domain-containing protein, partial [Thermohalobaculum sp.]|nr:protein-disulfide reductase DsbD domain-containing protein [Thermohalobaculum sp.]